MEPEKKTNKERMETLEALLESLSKRFELQEKSIRFRQTKMNEIIRRLCFFVVGCRHCGAIRSADRAGMRRFVREIEASVEQKTPLLCPNCKKPADVPFVFIPYREGDDVHLDQS